MRFEDAARAAAEAIRDRPAGTRWFIDCDTDADGVCGAAVTARALTGIGHRFQVRASRDKTQDAYEALADAACDGYILIDKGTSHIDVLAAMGRKAGRPVVVLDHHNVPDVDAGGVVHVNPRLCGLDGSRDASAATTAMAVALALDERTLEMGGAALAGAIGDWQHDGGWQGYNAQLLGRLEAAGHVTRRRVPGFIGVDLAEAVARRVGVTREEAAALLEDLQIAADAEAEALDTEAATRLVSAATLLAAAKGQATDFTMEILWDARLGGLRHAFRIVDACGRSGEAGTGLSYLWGSKSATAEAMRLFADYKARLVQAIAKLQEGVEERKAYRVARIDDPSLTGMVAGLGVVHFSRDEHRPLVVMAPRGDGAWQVSTRGTHDQVEAGLDLGRAIQEAAKAVGAEGGGHPIASGAVIPEKDITAFLTSLDAALEALP